MSEPKRPAVKKRRWKRFLIGMAVVLFLLLVLYPLWLPWVLKPVGARFGLHFERCERHDYAGFEFSNVDWTSGSTSIRAEQVRVQMPHRILWAHLAGTTSADPRVFVRGWRLEVSQSEEPAEVGTGSTSAVLDDVQNAVPSALRWLDWIVLTNGEFDLEAKHYPIDSVTLRDRSLRVNALKTDATLDLTSLAASALSLSVSNQQGRVGIQMHREDGRWAFDGGVLWQSNRFELKGWFAPTNWVPAVATLGCDSLQVPSAFLGLRGFTDLQGRAQAAWTNGTYRFNLDLSNQPQAGEGWRPERIALRMKAAGDLEVVRIDQLDLNSPLAEARLEHPLILDYSGHVRQGSTALRMWTDLGQIESVPLTGQLAGEIVLQPVTHSVFRGRFNLRGAGVEGFGVKTKTLALAGRLDWPNLDLGTINATFPFGGSLAASLQLDVSDRRLEDLKWHLDGSALNSLPGSVRIESMHAGGVASGVWPDLTHTGRVEVAGIQAGTFRAASAELTWSGQKLNLHRLGARLENGPSRLELAGQAELISGTNGLGAKVALDRLNLLTHTGVWRLKEPVQLNLLRQTNAFELNLSSLDLSGPDSRVAMQASVNWPAKGSGTLTLHNLRSSQWKSFFASELPDLRLPDLALSFSWDNGPLVGELDAHAQWLAESNLVWSATTHASADGQSLRFDSMRVDLDGVPCAQLTGNVPLRFDPATGWSAVEAGSGGQARFDLRVLEKAPVWSLLEQKSGVKVESPSVVVQARGKPPELQADVVLNAARVEFGQSNAGPAFVLPPLDRLHVDATAGLAGMEVRQLRASLLGQSLSAQAQWPIGASNWTAWWEALRTPDWKRVIGRLRLQHADLSALSAIAPEVIAPTGEADLDLALNPGLEVKGHLTITNGATRFLAPVGALRDIETDIALEGWDARIHKFTATLGGEPVELGGEMGWRPDGDHRLDLRLKGQNLSLLRDPDLFLRADLDLQLQKSFGEVARLSGDIGLRRSLLLRDFISLVRVDRERPEQRPPYFSIPQAPFGDWLLDVRVKGDRFMNVISPAFKGVVSAGLQLQGTLREPLAVGAVTVDEGKILFPFGTVDLESGRVELTREDPYRPHLDFMAQGQNFGYTITMELTGTAEAPNLTLQSVPVLSAQQILLMLTAGEIPRSDFGYSTTDKAARAGLYVGKEFVNRFIGNTSASERLIFRSGQYITDQGRPTYLLEYRLNDRWSVFGEYDRFQDINSGLKFKVLSK